MSKVRSRKKRKKVKERRSTVKSYARKYANYLLGNLGSRPPDPPKTMNGLQGRRVRKQVARALGVTGTIFHPVSTK